MTMAHCSLAWGLIRAILGVIPESPYMTGVCVCVCAYQVRTLHRQVRAQGDRLHVETRLRDRPRWSRRENEQRASSCEVTLRVVLMALAAGIVPHPNYIRSQRTKRRERETRAE